MAPSFTKRPMCLYLLLVRGMHTGTAARLSARPKPSIQEE
jgi:hypothetical protein